MKYIPGRDTKTGLEHQSDAGPEDDEADNKVHQTSGKFTAAKRDEPAGGGQTRAPSRATPLPLRITMDLADRSTLGQGLRLGSRSSVMAILRRRE